MGMGIIYLLFAAIPSNGHGNQSVCSGRQHGKCIQRVVCFVGAPMALDMLLNISKSCNGEKGPYQIIRTNMTTNMFFLLSLTLLNML
jgi:hypothetical protein